LACMPFAALTNFLSAILQAQGNTHTPLVVLASTGVLNVLLNLFFVLVLGLSVEGVAIATAIANLTSACILWTYLSKSQSDCRLSFKKLKINKPLFVEIARVGFPAGIQNAMFSISNILIQSSILKVNNAVTPPGSAYDPVIKGNAAVSSLEGFVFTALGAVTVTASAFTAQNVGANKYDRIKRALGEIILISVTIGVILSTAGMLLRAPLLSLYGVKNAPDLLARITYDSAFTRMIWKWPGFFIFAVMNACSGTLRGLGKSSLAALIAFLGTCVLRVVWIYTVFAYFENLESIHISYPISWFITGLCFLIIVLVMLRKKTRVQREGVPVGQN
ncbi:MAG: polysaccharide biosynthesis C-terminal domain-containing protein, partial [Clostridia bacterium]|nr:polysaccharide biosynthesis C-terminal domain-containing protein [Clostridia bacterium]